MSQKKKKKKRAPTRAADPLQRLSGARLTKAEDAVRKFLKLYGQDDSILDNCTRSQKKYLLQIMIEATRVRVADGNRMPRRLVTFFADEMHDHLKKMFFKDMDVGLTCYDALLYGLSFVLAACAWLQNPLVMKFSPEYRAYFQQIEDHISKERVFNDIFIINILLQHTAVMISKVNFRVYGYTWDLPGAFVRGTFKPTLYLSSVEAESIQFNYKGLDRTAFRIRTGLNNGSRPLNAVIDREQVMARRAGDSEKLEIFIQSHALQRIKERMDVFDARYRNYYSMLSLLYFQKVEHSPSGAPLLLCFSNLLGMPVEGDPLVFGYFPFVVIGDRLIVLTYLTPTLFDTPEGDLISKRLQLQKEDMLYLGMDKLSFFAAIDYERVPLLKEVIMETRLRRLLTFFGPCENANRYPIDEKKTALVQRFFEKKADFDRDRDSEQSSKRSSRR
jgi:hypothetical protein